MIALLLAIPIVTWDFAISNQGFLPSGDANQWEYGTPASGPGGSEKLWGTELGGLYLNDSVDYLEVPLPDLASVARPSLVFRHWYELAPGDAAWIEVDTGSGWARVDPVYGYPSADGYTGIAEWSNATVELEPFSGTTRVRFVFEADETFAEDGWYLSDVSLWDGDATPPRLTPIVEPGDTQNLDGPYKVQVLAEDDGTLEEVSLTWSTGGAETILAMTHLGAGIYQGLIPAQPPDTVVSWQVTATDAGDNASLHPPTATTSFRVYLAAPTGVAVSYDARPVGDQVSLSWSPPASPHPVQSYTVQDAGATLEPIPVEGTSVDLVVEVGDPQLWRVAAVYEAGTGDWSSTVDLDLEVPSLSALTPSAAVQGETVHLTLTGASLYLLEGVTSLDLGAGIEVLELDVRDVDTLDALVFVHGAAAVGPRDITVQGAHGAVSFDDAFEVLDQSLAMRVVSVEPGALVQGATAEVVVRASEAFAGPVTVQHGDDLVLQTAPIVEGDEVRFELAVSMSATPGTHTLVLDDGARMLQAQLIVDERVYQMTSNGCRTAPLGVGGVALLALFGLVTRRRARQRRQG